LIGEIVAQATDSTKFPLPLAESHREIYFEEAPGHSGTGFFVGVNDGSFPDQL
jgi:hypothetical protein